MQSLTPRNLYRHGQMTDDEHQAAREHIALLERHLLDVKDAEDMNAPAGNPVGRPSGTANGPSAHVSAAGGPLPARSWIKAGGRNLLDCKGCPDTGRWRCPQQNDLARALIGVREELPESRKVVEAATAPVAYGTASQARQEVNRALQQLHAGAAEADAGGPPA